jgi:hypothetical protein
MKHTTKTEDSFFNFHSSVYSVDRGVGVLLSAADASASVARTSLPHTTNNKVCQHKKKSYYEENSLSSYTDFLNGLT